MTGWICMAVFAPPAELLERQISSLASQTVTDWRCLVGIDGSDPHALARVQGLVDGDSRFEVIEFPDRVGFYRNFERLVAAVPADADWVALCDQDDEWHSDKLETLLPGLGRAAAVVGAATVVDSAGRVISARTRRRHADLFALLLDNQVTGSLAVFNPAVLRSALPFPEPTAVSYHDHWLGVCAEACGGVLYLDTLVQRYVQHAQNAIGEERGWRLVARLRGLVGGPDSALRKLRVIRWGWRVRMARTLVDRVSMEDGAALAGLRNVARGRASLGLLRAMVRRVLNRSAPPGRTFALALGAMLWRERQAES